MQVTPLWSTLVLASLALACSDSSGGTPTTASTNNSESEPNDSPGQARAFAVGQNLEGEVANGLDRDWWRVQLSEGDLVRFEAFALRSDMDTWAQKENGLQLILFDETQTLLQVSFAEALADTDLPYFRAPADGTYYLLATSQSLAFSGGRYHVQVRTVPVDGVPQHEQEPAGTSGANETIASAEAIEPGLVYGHYLDDEVDTYRLETTEPSLVRLTMVANRLASLTSLVTFDPFLYLYDSGGTELASNDDVFAYDSSIWRLLDTPGDYYVGVDEYSLNELSSDYVLLYERVPTAGLELAEVEPNDDLLSAQPIQFGDLVRGTTGADADVFVLTCAAGDRFVVERFASEDSIAGGTDDTVIEVLDGSGNALDVDGTNPSDPFLTTLLETSGVYFVRVQTLGVSAPYAFRARQVGGAFEAEPNDLVTEASAFDAEGRAAGRIDTPGDVDVFAFDAEEGVPVVLNCYASAGAMRNALAAAGGFGSSMAPVLTVRNLAGDELARVDVVVAYADSRTAEPATAMLLFQPPSTDTFYVFVADTVGASGDGYHYALELR